MRDIMSCMPKIARLLKYTALLIALSILLIACRSTAPATGTPATGTTVPAPEPVAVSPLGPGLPEGTDGMPWWNDTVYYEVFVRSFYDSDSDGVGDLRGLIEKLDYLNDGDPETTDDLGITGIWLMPVMESPSYHGYDVVDYYQVDQEYGDAEDFRELMAAAHERGIRVIVDMVLNHSSREHPWFEEAADPAGDRHDWYLWADEDPGYSGPWGQVVWHQTADGYYYGVFWEGMPDLNLTNEEVTAEMHAASQFWLEEMGVDGFRLDAIKHLIEDGEIQENTDETHAWLQEFYDLYKEANPDAFAVGEAWTTTDEVLDYIGDEVDVAFEFDLALAILNSVNDGRKDGVLSYFGQVVANYPPGQYGVFLANHDQNRVMSQLANDENKARIAATILLTSPGVPFIYYGEEIGMRGIKPDEDIRRPMQWSAEANAGFTTGDPWRPPHSSYPDANVEGQSTDPDSLLNHYRALIRLRNEHEALRIGEWMPVQTNIPDLYAFLRHSDDEVLLVLVNMDEEALTDYQLDLASSPLTSEHRAVMLLGDGDLTEPEVNAEGGFNDFRPLDELGPFSSTIIQFYVPQE